MLPPFIIEQIRQREEEERTRQREDAARPRLEVPNDFPRIRRRPELQEDDDPDRGVLIVDLG